MSGKEEEKHVIDVSVINKKYNVVDRNFSFVRQNI